MMGKGKAKSKVNEAGNYTKPGMRKSLFKDIKSGGEGEGGAIRLPACLYSQKDG